MRTCITDSLKYILVKRHPFPFQAINGVSVCQCELSTKKGLKTFTVRLPEYEKRKLGGAATSFGHPLMPSDEFKRSSVDYFVMLRQSTE